VTRTRIAALFVLALAACREEPAPPAAAPTAAPTAAAPAAAQPPKTVMPPDAPREPVGEVTKSPEGGQSVRIGGVTIDVAPDLPERPHPEGGFSLETSNGIAMSLRGWPILLRDGHVYVGGKDFGEAPEQSRIVLSKDGVRVAGELRGPLP
jgi:hypothetical protein